MRDLSSEDFMWAAEGAAHAGAAKRRRERRHRAYLKYAQMSVAVALSEYKHHTSRGQRMDRAGVWGHELNTPQPEFFSLEEQPGEVRPDRLSAVSGPQERVQLRTVQHIFDPVPSFRALSLDPEQVIEVPKILPKDVSLRTAGREPQLVEQLVEVPTIVSFSSLQRTVEQNVDIPVWSFRFSPRTAFFHDCQADR